MQRVGDHWRIDHLLDRDDVAQHRMRVVLRMVRGGHLDPGQLLTGGAVLMHVPHCRHRVHVGRGRRIGKFEAGFRHRHGRGARRRAGRHALGSRPPGQGDQRDRAFAERDRHGGMVDLMDIGGAADIGRIHVLQLEAEIIDHRQRAEPRRVARGAEVAVDIVLAEAGIGERARQHLGVQLWHGLVGGEPRRVLVNPDDVGLVPDAHRRPSLPVAVR